MGMLMPWLPTYCTLNELLSSSCCSSCKLHSWYCGVLNVPTKLFTLGAEKPGTVADTN